MENKYLIEKYKTPEEVEQAREEIEQQLTDFEKGLWVINDSTKISDGDPKNIKVKKNIDGSKSSSSSSSTAHSARDRRKKF